MLTHSQKKVMLDELNSIKVGYDTFAKLASKRFPEPKAVAKAKVEIKRLERLVQRYDERVEKFRKSKNETAYKLRAEVRRAIEFDDIKVVQAYMKVYVKFMSAA